jgi:glycosyltransferase involved in cell wall biosynthesis
VSDVVGAVVIPAHQEEAVIGRCLRALLDGPHDLEVVVVVNGSSDRTAEVARAVPVPAGHSVTVLDLPEGSKIGALRAGDAAATAFPRLYVDADVRVDNEAAGATLAALRDPDGPLAAAPRLTYDLVDCPWVVAAYTRVWLALHNTPSMIGSGAYGLGRAGRRRVGEFPDVIADDAYVRSRFAPGERRAVEPPFVAYPPRRTTDLLKRKSRVFLGHLELEQRGEALDLDHNLGPVDLLKASDRPPVVEIVAYGVVTVLSKLRARWQLWRGRTDHWERDESSRVV